MTETKAIQHILNEREAIALAAVAGVGLWALQEEDIFAVLMEKDDKLLFSILRMLSGSITDEAAQVNIGVAQLLGGSDAAAIVMGMEVSDAIQAVRAKVAELIGGVIPEYREKAGTIRNPLRGPRP